MTEQPPVPFRIVPTIARPPKELIAELATCGVSPMGGLLFPTGTLDAAIQPLDRSWSCIGPAFTVDLPEPDPALVMLAIDLAEPGDVLVVAARGKLHNLCFAGGMARSAKNRGIAGVVIDGAVSNIVSLTDRHKLPVFARGTTPGHRVGYLPGSINVPVTCGGVLIQPGDAVVGMADGVIAVPQDRIASVIAALKPAAPRHDRTVEILNAGGTVGQALGVRERFQRPDVVWES